MHVAHPAIAQAILHLGAHKRGKAVAHPLPPAIRIRSPKQLRHCFRHGPQKGVRAAQLPPQVMLLANVALDREPVRLASTLSGYRNHRQLNHELAAVLSVIHQLFAHRRARLQRLANPVKRRPIRLRPLQNPRSLPHNLLRRIPRHALERGIDIQHARSRLVHRLRLGNQDDIVGTLHGPHQHLQESQVLRRLFHFLFLMVHTGVSHERTVPRPDASSLSSRESWQDDSTSRNASIGYSSHQSRTPGKRSVPSPGTRRVPLPIFDPPVLQSPHAPSSAPRRLRPT
jgi:hypothetical protein